MAYNAALLTEIDAAISAIVTGRVSQISVNGSTYTFHDLEKLRSLRADVVKAIGKATRGRFAYARRARIGS